IRYLRQAGRGAAFLAVIWGEAPALPRPRPAKGGAPRSLLLSQDGKDGVLAFLYGRSRDSGLGAARLGTAATLSAPRRTAVRREGDGLFISADRVVSPLIQSQAKETDP